MNQTEFIIKAREWQKNNPQWELICDMGSGDVDALYSKFGDMPTKERMSWIGKFGRDAVKAWEEFGTRKCKVNRMFLNESMELVSVWPDGCAMTCFETNTQKNKDPLGDSIIEGRMFRSSVSGLWYKSASAAGSVDAVEIKGHQIERIKNEPTMIWLRRVSEWASKIWTESEDFSGCPPGCECPTDKGCSSAGSCL